MSVEMIPLTIRLPQPEAAFLERYAARHCFSISELIDMYIKQLQIAEQFFASAAKDAAIEAEFQQHAGVIPSDVDVRQEYYEYLEEKHS